MKKILSAIALIALLAGPALAKNWIEIGERHYIDADSIRQSTNYGTYTFDTKYLAKDTPLEILNGRQVWTVKTYSYIDCPNAYAKTLSYTAYDADDNKIGANRYIQKQWYNIAGGGRGSEAYTFICTDKYLNKYPGYHKLWWY